MSLSSHLEHWLHKQWRKRGLFSQLLRPLSGLVRIYIKKKAQRPRATLAFTPPPIIVVGNIIVGGAGKTPVVLALCDFLQKHGWQPGIISRGYGVSIKGPARVGQGQLDPTLFGDEPTLLAAQSLAPIAVHPSRILALSALCEQYSNVDVVIADDGLQHQALPRDIEIIVQDARGIANGLVLPAGPLREPPARLQQADWLITQLGTAQKPPLTPTPLQASRCVSMQLWPVFFEQLGTGKRLAAAHWLTEIYTQSPACSTLALAAIGQPSRFFTMLKQFGIRLDKEVALADHDQLTAAGFEQFEADFLFITAKDAVKYPSVTDSRIWVVHVSPQFSPSHWLCDLHLHLNQLNRG